MIPVIAKNKSYDQQKTITDRIQKRHLNLREPFSKPFKKYLLNANFKNVQLDFLIPTPVINETMS